MFDKQKFSEIFKSIYNKYDNQRDFASATGVNRAYISQYMNMKLENPPTPKILKKIADNSKGVTTYEKLMEVCGYIDNFSKELINNDLYIKKIEQKKEIQNKIDIYKSKLSKKAKEFYDEEITLLRNKKMSDEDYDIYFDNVINDLTNKYKLSFIDQNRLIKIYTLENELVEIQTIILEKEIVNHTINNPQTVKIPIVGTVAAGEPILAQQNIIDYEELPANEYSDGEYFGLKIKGNSMFPRILEDDVVIVKRQTTAETGQIAVVLINGDEATVKQIKKTESGLMLIPFNTNEYSPMFFTKEDVENKPVKIIGIVKRLIGYNFG